MPGSRPVLALAFLALYGSAVMPIVAKSVKAPILGDYGGNDIQWFVKLHVDQDPSGTLTGTNDIVDIGVYGIPCADVVL